MASKADVTTGRQTAQTAGQPAATDIAPTEAREVMRPVTVRFAAGAWEAIRDTAAENGVSMAELVRMAVAGNLYRYLGDVRIIDKKQGAEIKKTVSALCDTVSRMETELRRIGINYNQEIRLKQIERKYKNRGLDFNAISAKINEEAAVKKECEGFSPEHMEELITRYEQATKQVGEILCRILT